MANESPFTRESASRTDPVVGSTSTLLCGAGIDASAAGAFAIGATNATTITIGRSGQTVSFPGTVSIATTSSTVDIVDRVIHLGVTTGNAAVPTLPIGISADRGASAGTKRDMSSLVWDETASRWKFCLITTGDDATLSTYQTVQALRFDAPTFGRADAGALSFGGAATSIVAGAPITFDAAQVGVIQTRTVTIGHADLTDADGEQSINIGAVLPANAMILAVDVALATPFSGGTATSVLLDIGTSGDPDAIVADCDLFAAAVDGKASAMPAGIAPFKLFTSAGAQLLATVAADDDVADLVAGACTITVSFVKVA